MKKSYIPFCEKKRCRLTLGTTHSVDCLHPVYASGVRYDRWHVFPNDEEGCSYFLILVITAFRYKLAIRNIVWYTLSLTSLPL